MNYPIIIPYSTNTSGSDGTYTEKCLESSELSDLLEKSLRGETFTEEDTTRILECVETKRADNEVVSGIILGFGIVAIVVVIIIAIKAFRLANGY